MILGKGSAFRDEFQIVAKWLEWSYFFGRIMKSEECQTPYGTTKT